MEGQVGTLVVLGSLVEIDRLSHIGAAGRIGRG